MGTEVAISFSNLRTQLENEKSSLFKIDENIKKIVQTSGRFPNDRFNSSGEYNRGGGRIGGRAPYSDTSKNEDSFGKRKHETKTVFSRLSGRADSDGEEDSGVKRGRVESAVWREVPTRAQALRAQAPDEQARTRNRRIFGSLLGTLQKFKQEEIVLQTKEDKKALVERKIEEQARLEKEREQKERKTLFAEREHKKATIKVLEAKMARVQEFEKWETSQKSLSNFILTKSKPHIYWLPKKMTDKATEKLTSSTKFHEKCMIKKKQELEEELQRIEQRCLRGRGPAAKENEPRDAAAGERRAAAGAPEATDTASSPDDKTKKRDKFAMDVDEQDKDSDAEDRPHDTDAQIQSEHENESDESKVEIKDESVEPNTTTDTNGQNTTELSDSMLTDANNDNETDKDNQTETEAQDVEMKPIDGDAVTNNHDEDPTESETAEHS